MSPRRRLVLALLAAVVAVGVALAVLLPRLGPGPRAVTVAQDAPGPVLLVPGYGGGTRGLDVLARALRAAGRDARVVPVAGDGTGDLAGQAGQLDAAARAALRAGAPSVDVVGYSAGGVVARVWLAGTGAGVAVRRVLTLGSPHAGTQLAAFAGQVDPGACPTACRQLAPGSDLLTGLPATPGRRSSARSGPGGPGGPGGSVWTSVWSTTDEVVVPPRRASALPGAVGVELQAVCPGADVAHGALPRDPESVGVVDAALDGPPLTAPPGAARCGALRETGQRLLAG